MNRIIFPAFCESKNIISSDIPKDKLDEYAAIVIEIIKNGLGKEKPESKDEAELLAKRIRNNYFNLNTGELIE